MTLVKYTIQNCNDQSEYRLTFNNATHLNSGEIWDIECNNINNGCYYINEDTNKVLDEIIKSIKPEDNLFSVEYLLRDKGYDVHQFKERVSDLEAEKAIALTPQQKRQQKRSIKQNIFGDILYESF